MNQFGRFTLQYCWSLWLRTAISVVRTSVVVVSVVAAGRSKAQQPTLELIVDAMAAREEGVRNIVVRSSYEELSDGLPAGWEDLVVFRDDLARIRLEYTAGSLSSDGRRLKVNPNVVEVYDGEKTAHIEYDATLDRLGKKPETASAPFGYRWAQIHDGSWPPPHGLAFHRDPWSSISAPVMRALSILRERGQDLKTLSAANKNGVLRFEFLIPDDANDLRAEVTIDSAKGGNVTRVDEFSPAGRLVRVSECDFRLNGDGIWVPKNGSFKTFGLKDRPNNSVPIVEWRYVVHEVKVNDPAFDEKVFDIVLEPDTAVSDIRYGVSYRVGNEKVMSAELSRLAEVAKETAAKAEAPLSPISSNWSSGRIWALVGTAAVIVAVLLLRTRHTA
jgi:hypothetical protein